MQHEIGGGSFGKVHLAKWRETTVAVKILSGGVLPEENNIAAVPHNMLLALQKVCALHPSVPRPLTFTLLHLFSFSSCSIQCNCD